MCFGSCSGNVKNTFTHFFKLGDPVSIAFSLQAAVQSTQTQSTALHFQLKYLFYLAGSQPALQRSTCIRSIHRGCASAAVNPGLA